ncbi:uncharacterized protein LOC143880640 [Tasmannia lanceolata]|uniref:uncharacterized protein LOC143880640 n=1 Tax=Tasmannia lanceolata TaxID=3420 RepID=UPI0040633054
MGARVYGEKAQESQKIQARPRDFRMSSSGASNAAQAAHTSSTDEDLSKPLWKHVSRFDKDPKGGGNVRWQCNFCSKRFSSSYTRVRTHLLKITGQGIGPCPKVKASDLLAMQRFEEECKERMKQNAPKRVPLPPSSSSGSLSWPSNIPVLPRFDLKRRKTSGPSGSVSAIEKAFNMAARDRLHGEIARMFYSGGLPFHLARNPHYASSYSYASNNPIFGYLPPGYNLLRTTLLQKEMANVDMLQPLRDTWKDKGVSIVSDGWSDSQMRPLINFMVVTEGSPMFLKAVDCSGETKDKHFIANLLKEVIMEVGHENVVQVITDNVANSIFNEFNTLKLLFVAETRFASVIVMLKRLKLLKQGLQAMVISKQWYYSEQWLSEDSSRVPPHKDAEIYTERIKCFKRYFTNSEDRTRANVEFAKFSMKSGLFNDVDSINERFTIKPHEWWAIHGTCAPMLQSIALKILMQPSSSSCAERNWSTYSFMHSLKRNKITPQRAQGLVFVHSNLRLLSRQTPQYKQGETKMWDIGGDTFDSCEDVGVLEVASLSLDEPELESIIFTDDVEDDVVDIGDEATDF